ncbi:TPA: conjugal transfer protein, partial [Enterococcus faecalis]|nr:conjugal transfer protein [Enterococcus faecalis]
PFSISNKGCRIIAYPYFTALPKNTEKQRMITYDDTLYETVDASEAKDVEGFVEDFLDKYAKNNAKDMSYMMKEPEGLNQTAKVDQVEMKVLRYKETKKPFIVKATVVFRDGDTSLLQKEQMTIVITKKTNQYYVEKLTHNWLDRKGEERK